MSDIEFQIVYYLSFDTLRPRITSLTGRGDGGITTGDKLPCTLGKHQ